MLSSLVVIFSPIRKCRPRDNYIPVSILSFIKNISISGDSAAIRNYTSDLIPDVLEGMIQLGKVFDLKGSIGQVLQGYCAMNDRQAIKLLIEF
jgi:hypothetical protein